MTVNDLAPFADAKQQEPLEPVGCTQCGSAEDLILEFAGTDVSFHNGAIALEYSCGTCEAFFAHTASAEGSAPLLSASIKTLGMLQSGDTYLHCGEPMEEGELQLSALKVEDGDLMDAPSVRVEMTVLKCPCGFQMSIPTA